MASAGILFLTMMSGCVALADGVTDATLWPISKAACPPGQKMTLQHGCQDTNADSAGTVGRTLSLLSCVASIGAVWWTAGAIASLMVCSVCAIASLVAGLVADAEYTRRRNANNAG